MRKGPEVGDYLRIWKVEFAERFSPHSVSRKTVTARSIDEALKKARSLERKESPGIPLKVASVERCEVLDG